MTDLTTRSIIEPQVLTDLSRLQEIYDLRVESYENSGHKKYINRSFFPNGWKDHLDERSQHWIVEDEGKIIASARLCVLSDMNDMEEEFANFVIPDIKPFAFYSRLVVHHNYRGKGIPAALDRIRMEYIHANNIRLILAWASLPKRRQTLEKMNFTRLGEVPHNYGTNPMVDMLAIYMLRLG